MEQNNLTDTDKVLATVNSAGDWVANTLDKIANSLGTTIEYLWPTYVKQVIAQGVQQIFIGVFFCVLGIILSRAFYKISKNLKENPPRGNYGGDDYFPSQALTFFSWIALILGIILCACFVSTGITDIMAPEPTALNNLLHSVGSSRWR